MPLLGAKDVGLLLGFADEQDAFVPLEPGQVLLGHVVFSLPIPERHQIDMFSLGEAIDRIHSFPRTRGDVPCYLSS